MITYATDEDLAIRAPADWLALCPKDQVVVAGTDGLFLVTDRWTLRSPTVNFADAGLLAGQMVRLGGQSASSLQGDFYVVASVGPSGLALRQKGQAPGVGRPPAVATGIEFTVRTLIPQLNRAAEDLRSRFGIDEAVLGRRACDLQESRGLRDATVLMVLARQYLDQARLFAQKSDGNSEVPSDWYGTKARLIKAELDELLDRLALQGTEATDSGRTTSCARFATRLSR